VPSSSKGVGIALDIGRDEFDALARKIVGQRPTHGLRAGVLCDDLAWRRRRNRRLGIAGAQRQTQHQQRKLSVVLR